MQWYSTAEICTRIDSVDPDDDDEEIDITYIFADDATTTTATTTDLSKGYLIMNRQNQMMTANKKNRYTPLNMD
jgi:hypothetical protein